MVVVILMGGPGAGKGTQARRLSEHASLAHVSTGDLFRANVGEGTELGKKAKRYMDAGEYVPDELVLDMLFDRVSAPDCANGYILDGFPRTVPQAEALSARLNGSPPCVVAIEVSDEAIVERAAGRLLCRDCGNIHHAEHAPPKVEGVCDACGGELYRREDDAPKVVQKRLDEYHELTGGPVKSYYEERGVLNRVDGERSPDAVFESLRAIVDGEEGAC
jgi:adenylate kinase